MKIVGSDRIGDIVQRLKAIHARAHEGGDLLDAGHFDRGGHVHQDQTP
jgi:hypothetical protein